MQRLESELLRTFLAVAEAGSMTAGAELIHRSQSAASAQIKQLEEVLGRPVFARHGRGIVLNTTGEALIPIARQVTGLLDGAMADLGGGLEGAIRIAIPDDYAPGALARIIAGFARDHPKVELTVRCVPSAGFSKALADGTLDLAVHEVERVGPNMELLREETLHWVRSRNHDPARLDPVPVALFDRACWWRDVALQALGDGGRRYRIAYSSESVIGVAAAIEAGIAVGLLRRSVLTDAMAVLSGSEGFAELPSSKLVLEHAPGRRGRAFEAMAHAIRTAFTQMARVN